MFASSGVFEASLLILQASSPFNRLQRHERETASTSALIWGTEQVLTVLKNSIGHKVYLVSDIQAQCCRGLENFWIR